MLVPRQAMENFEMKICPELKRRISEKLHILDFRIFGSRARGDGDEYSDLDVYIEADEISAPIRRFIQDTAWEIGFENSILIAPVIVSKEEIDGIELNAAPFLRNVMSEGVPV